MAHTEESVKRKALKLMLEFATLEAQAVQSGLKNLAILGGKPPRNLKQLLAEVAKVRSRAADDDIVKHACDRAEKKISAAFAAKAA